MWCTRPAVSADLSPPLPLSLDEAQRLVERRIGGDLVVDTEHTIERSWGWAFALTSRRYKETGDLEDMPIGLGPVLVDRHDGSAHCFDSSAPAEIWADRYGRQLARRRRRERVRAFLRRLWPLG